MEVQKKNIDAEENLLHDASSSSNIVGGDTDRLDKLGDSLVKETEKAVESGLDFACEDMLDDIGKEETLKGVDLYEAATNELIDSREAEGQSLISAMDKRVASMETAVASLIADNERLRADNERLANRSAARHVADDVANATQAAAAACKDIAGAAKSKFEGIVASCRQAVKEGFAQVRSFVRHEYDNVQSLNKFVAEYNYAKSAYKNDSAADNFLENRSPVEFAEARAFGLRLAKAEADDRISDMEAKCSELHGAAKLMMKCEIAEQKLERFAACYDDRIVLTNNFAVSLKAISNGVSEAANSVKRGVTKAKWGIEEAFENAKGLASKTFWESKDGINRLVGRATSALSEALLNTAAKCEEISNKRFEKAQAAAEEKFEPKENASDEKTGPDDK